VIINQFHLKTGTTFGSWNRSCPANVNPQINSHMNEPQRSSVAVLAVQNSVMLYNAPKSKQNIETKIVA
jgi:hypothetical protein